MCHKFTNVFLGFILANAVFLQSSSINHSSIKSGLSLHKFCKILVQGRMTFETRHRKAPMDCEANSGQLYFFLFLHSNCRKSHWFSPTNRQYNKSVQVVMSEPLVGSVLCRCWALILMACMLNDQSYMCLLSRPGVEVVEPTSFLTNPFRFF